MSEKFRPDRKISFQNTYYTKRINVIIESIGPSIILRSIFTNYFLIIKKNLEEIFVFDFFDNFRLFSMLF